MFTQSLGCYDSVLSYGAVDELPADQPTVYVDFSGSVDLRSELHHHLGESLTCSSSVGGTHWQELGSGQGLPGPRPTLFFAPAQIKKRHADRGAAVLQRRTADAWNAFMGAVTDAKHPWLRVVRSSGPAAVESAYAAMLGGQLDPAEGYLLSVHAAG